MTNNEIKTTEAELLNNYLDSIPSCDRKYFAREVVRRCGNGITMKTFYNWKYMSCRIPVFAKKIIEEVAGKEIFRDIQLMPSEEGRIIGRGCEERA